MNIIGVIANLDKAGVKELLPLLSQRAKVFGLRLLYDPACAPETPCPDYEAVAACEQFPDQADAVLTLGGDGTLLGAVRRMGTRPKPVLGINMGKLGFLTAVTQDQLDEALEAFKADRLIASKRRLLLCRYPDPESGDLRECLALNDVVLSWGISSHIAHLEVSVDQEEITHYTCDGLIISTPTGSTGHSLSAGGPVLHPRSDALVLSPICPHAMGVRPVVLHGTAEIMVTLGQPSKSLVLAADGQPAAELKPGDRLTVGPADVRLDLLHLEGYQYWQVLRQKLHWRGSTLSGLGGE